MNESYLRTLHACPVLGIAQSHLLLFCGKLLHLLSYNALALCIMLLTKKAPQMPTQSVFKNFCVSTQRFFMNRTTKTSVQNFAGFVTMLFAFSSNCSFLNDNEKSFHQIVCDKDVQNLSTQG